MLHNNYINIFTEDVLKLLLDLASKKKKKTIIGLNRPLFFLLFFF